ncbi:MAG: hypothetical protein DDT20_01860 [Firmicutes bacterium]|nr:hypothetical protein [Bacillota bacterium]
MCLCVLHSGAGEHNVPPRLRLVRLLYSHPKARSFLNGNRARSKRANITYGGFDLLGVEGDPPVARRPVRTKLIVNVANPVVAVSDQRLAHGAMHAQVEHARAVEQATHIHFLVVVAGKRPLKREVYRHQRIAAAANTGSP